MVPHVNFISLSGEQRLFKIHFKHENKKLMHEMLECFSSVPPSGSESLKSPSTDIHLLPSPPQIRQRSSRTSEPRTRSQPTCCEKRETSELQGHTGSRGTISKSRGVRGRAEGLPLMSSRPLFQNTEISDAQSRCVF